MAVHWNPAEADKAKTQIVKEKGTLCADRYPPGGFLPDYPVSKRGKRRVHRKSSGIARGKT